MAKNKPLPTDYKTERVKVTDMLNMSWVLNNLSDKEISAMDDMPFDGERFSEFMEKLVDNGFDVKLGWDTYSKAYQITAMGSWQGFENAGIACSARGVDIFDAWKILWFKVDFVAAWDLRQFVAVDRTKPKRG